MTRMVRDMSTALFLTYITKFQRRHPENEGTIILSPSAPWHNLALTCWSEPD